MYLLHVSYEFYSDSEIQKEFILVPLIFGFNKQNRVALAGSPSWSVIFLHPVVPQYFLFSFCPHAATSCDILVGDQNQNCLFIFLHSALPLLAMDLCWTSTSASAGGDSTIQAEWRSMALKVGYKSLCDIKIHFAVGCQIKTLNLSKVSFWDLWKKQKTNKKKPLLFQLTATRFGWNPSYVFEWVSWGLWG